MQKKSSKLSRLQRIKKSDIIFSDNAAKEINALKHKKINLTDKDALEVTNWEQAIVGKFYRLML